MPDVFGRNVELGTGFKADGAKIKFAGKECADGLLIQNISIQYQQQVNRLYEVGCPQVYLIAGRTQGTISMARVIGPKGIMVDFYEEYGNPCNDRDLEIDLSPGMCEKASNSAITAKKAIITSIGISVAANDMLINEQMQWMFVTLESGQSGSSGGSPGADDGLPND